MLVVLHALGITKKQVDKNWRMRWPLSACSPSKTPLVILCLRRPFTIVHKPACLPAMQVWIV